MDRKFVGTIIKVKDGSTVPDDEYIVFLVKDTAFANTLPTYRAECAELGSDFEQLEAVDKMIDRVKVWRMAHRERCKVPDARGEKLLDDNGQ